MLFESLCEFDVLLMSFYRKWTCWTDLKFCVHTSFFSIRSSCSARFSENRGPSEKSTWLTWTQKRVCWSHGEHATYMELQTIKKWLRNRVDFPLGRSFTESTIEVHLSRWRSSFPLQSDLLTRSIRPRNIQRKSGYAKSRQLIVCLSIRWKCFSNFHQLSFFEYTCFLFAGEEKFVSSNYVIENMDRHKGGTYICTANNGVGQTASSQIALHVLCK